MTNKQQEKERHDIFVLVLNYITFGAIVAIFVIHYLSYMAKEEIIQLEARRITRENQTDMMLQEAEREIKAMREKNDAMTQKLKQLNLAIQE